MAEENTPEEDDVEAEMLRMMQEEIGGGDADSAEGTPLAEGAGELGGEADGLGNIDEMLEQEMLRAMQSESGDVGGAMTAFTGSQPVLSGEDLQQGIERLADVDVNVTVELGGTSIAIKDIMEWTRDSIVELEPMENDPVDVLVNGKLFARGEVVVVGDTFGVRIIELVDQPKDPSFRNR